MKFKKSKDIRTLTLIIVSSIVLILFFTGFSIGKAMVDVKIKNNTEIAKPILIVENNPSIDITAIKNTGKYNFKIKNYDENDQINEIELKYYIEIISKYDESISFKIYKNNEEIPLTNNRTNEMILSKNEKKDEEFILEIVYDKTKSTSTQEIIQDVQIKVHSEQNKA